MIDLRHGPARAPKVNEERLRSTAGVRGAVALSSWRGRSGRRYVVGIHPLTEKELVDLVDAVVLAVRRDADGLAHLIEAIAAGPRSRDPARLAWGMQVREQGATELHVHRLADGARERQAVIDDLRDDPAPAF